MDTPTTADAEAVRELRSVLKRAGYDPAGIAGAVGAGGTFTRDPLDMPLYLRRLAPDTVLSTLIKIFLLDVAVPREEAARAFEPLDLERVLGLGIVRQDGETIASTIDLYPAADNLVVGSDRLEESRRRADYVMGTSISGRVLAAITVRTAVDSALDLGTGAGLQALAASPHVRRVVATDINPRALAFTEFNLALNGVLNIETRLGSTFEPVEGETFDLIVGNPPYVISPDSAYAYRDSGLPGDSFSEGLVRRLPEFLNDGGFGHLLVEWAHGPDEDWSAPLRRWIEGSGCDALLLRHHSQDPLTYAATWNQELRADAEEYARSLDRWVEYDRSLGIEQIAWGAVVLRRRRGDNWVRPLDTPWNAIGHASEHVARIFGSHDYLRSRPIERGLLGAVLALPVDHRIDQTFLTGAGAGQLADTTLRLESGLGTQAKLQGRILRVLTLLDGQQPLGDILAEAASAEGDGVSPEELAAETLAGIVQLVESGLIAPVE